MNDLPAVIEHDDPIILWRTLSATLSAKRPGIDARLCVLDSLFEPDQI